MTMSTGHACARVLSRIRIPFMTAVVSGAALVSMNALAGEEIMRGTIDGEEHVWERLEGQGDSPAFFTDVSSNVELFNLHGFKDGGAFDPRGSMVFSTSRMGDRLVNLELGYYENSSTGPDFLASDHVGEIDYTIDTIEVEGDTARISGEISGELHYVEDALHEEYDASRTRSVTVEFDTTLPRQ